MVNSVSWAELGKVQQTSESEDQVMGWKDLPPEPRGWIVGTHRSGADSGAGRVPTSTVTSIWNGRMVTLAVLSDPLCGWFQKVSLRCITPSFLTLYMESSKGRRNKILCSDISSMELFGLSSKHHSRRKLPAQ